MRFAEFEYIISSKRMRKYLVACGGDTRKAMVLYRLNLKLSQEIFTVISCFEVALRNAIDRQLVAKWGSDWLRDFVLPGGVFYNEKRLETTCKIIFKAYEGLFKNGTYSRDKLLAEMEFGVWKYMFSNIEYKLSGRVLLKIFPDKPVSTPTLNIDNTFIFRELDFINNMRNRIAHHEPICFNDSGQINTFYVESRYSKMIKLFDWMGINSASLLYGLNHVLRVCKEINNLK